MIGFSFSDDSEEKKKMLLRLDTPLNSEDPQNRITLSDHHLRAKEISDFATRNTHKFFEAPSLKRFPEGGPETWPDSILFCEIQRSMTKLRVSNVNAGRGVTPMQRLQWAAHQIGRENSGFKQWHSNLGFFRPSLRLLSPKIIK